MTKLTSPSGLISNTNCVRENQIHNIGGFDQTDVTYVRFINIGDTPITNIRGSLYDSSGNVIGSTNPILIDELPAKAHVWKNRNQLSDLVGNLAWAYKRPPTPLFSIWDSCYLVLGIWAND